MKVENAFVPIVAGISLATIASQITIHNEPAADAAGLALLVASHLLIVSGTLMFCVVTARQQKMSRRNMFNTEDF